MTALEGRALQPRAAGARLAAILIGGCSLLAVVADARAAAAPEWDGQVRLRYEFRSPLDYRLPGAFGRPATERLEDRGDVAVMRVRLGARVTPAPRVRVYVQLQDSRALGQEGSPSTAIDNLDLHQAFVDLDSLGGLPVEVRLGRQELLYGDQRLVSPLDWHNVGRSWDGVRARGRRRAVQLDGFLTWVAEGRKAGSDRLFAGLYLAWKGPHGVGADLYHFWRSFGDSGFVSEGGRGGSLDDRTAGARLRIAAGRLDACGEAALQRGRRAGDRVESWAAAAKLSAGLDAGGRLKATAEYLFASGDRNVADGEAGRFDPLYAFSHFYLGYLDVVGWANVRDLNGGLAIQPGPRWSAQAEFHRFELAEARDAWVDAAGNVVRRAPSGAAGRDLGRELDVVVRWTARPGTALLAGWSHLWPGDFVARSGGGGDADWGFAQLTVSF
jgi:hypothetical protein